MSSGPTTKTDADMSRAIRAKENMSDNAIEQTTKTIAALTARIAELEELRKIERARIRTEVFSLAEDTDTRYRAISERDTEGKEGAYARGRIAEAKSIARAIDEVFPALRGKEDTFNPDAPSS